MRKSSKSKLVTNAMLIGISAMLALSQPMAAMAGEFTENGGEAREGWHNLDNGPDTEDAKYNDAAAEAKAVHDGSAEVAAFEEAAAAAETAASEAADAVAEVQEQVKLAEGAIEAANTAVGTVTTATTTVTNATTTTSSQTSTDTTLTNNIISHNDAVEEAQGTVNGSATAIAGTTTVSVPVEKEEDTEESLAEESQVEESQVEESQAEEGQEEEKKAPETQEVDVADYAAAKAEEAKEAAASAKEALENALAVDTDEVNDEVLGYAQQVYDAADAAEEAKEAAGDAVTQATSNLEAAVLAYNNAATAQGLPKLVKNTTTGKYELETTSTLIAETDSLEQQLTTATTTADATVQNLATTVANTQQAVEAAQTAYNNACDNYDDAKEAADAAAQLVVDKVNAAATEADKAIFDDVNEAQAVYDTKAAAAEATAGTISQKTETLGSVRSQLSEARGAQQTAQQSYDAALNARNVAAQAAYNAKLVQLYSRWQNINGWRHPVDKTSAWAEYEKYKYFRDASDFYDDVDNTALNNATNTLNSAKATVSGLEGQESALLGEISNLNQTLSVQNAEKSAAESELNAARSAQQSLEAQIQAAYSAEDEEAAKAALKAQLDAVIKSYAVEINQTQYDKDLNDYVNKVWNGWNWDSIKFITKAQVREELDDHYDEYYDNFWKDLGDDIKDVANVIGITQWLVNKDEVNDLIDQCVALSTAAIIEQYKKQAIIDATYAKYAAEDTLDAADGEDITVIYEEGVAKSATAKIEGSIQSMENAITSYNSAKSTYTNAKSAYDTALAALKECKVDSVDFTALMTAVRNAEAKLAAAQESLETATEQASVAANFANWAEALTGTNRATASTGEKPVVAEPAYVLRASLVRAMVAAVPVADGVDVTSNDVAEGNTAYTEFGDVEIPYALFRQFVQVNYEALFGEDGQIAEYNTAQKSNTVYMWRVVDGVATELLKVVFDENGNPVSVNGEAVSSLNGTFFVASKLTSLGDGMYDLNGETVEIDYTAPVNVDPTPVNNVTTTASAASTGTVLGVSRETVLVDDMEEESAVLGADRPQTGDASQAGTWAGVMGAAATALAGMYLATKKRKDEEEA